MTAIARRGLKRLAPDRDKLLFRKYQLTREQKIIMIVTGLLLTQVAKFIGDGAYFLGFQMKFAASYPKGNVTYADYYITDWYDRLPVHVQNLFHAHWFAGQAAPAWWVTDRHLTRGIIIGSVAVILVQLLVVGLAQYKPVGKWRVVGSLAATFAVITLVSAGLIYLVTEVISPVMNAGAFATVPYAGDWFAKGAWQAVVIGVIATFAAKRSFRPAASAMQLASVDNKLLHVQGESWWWKFAYLPTYMNRYRMQRDLVSEGEYTPEDRGRLIGVMITVIVVVSLLCLVTGILVRYFGPAAHAH